MKKHKKGLSLKPLRKRREPSKGEASTPRNPPSNAPSGPPNAKGKGEGGKLPKRPSKGYTIRIRTYGTAPVCDCWIDKHDGAAVSSVLYGHIRTEKAEDLAKTLNLTVIREDVPQWVGSASAYKERPLPK